MYQASVERQETIDVQEHESETGEKTETDGSHCSLAVVVVCRERFIQRRYTSAGQQVDLSLEPALEAPHGEAIPYVLWDDDRQGCTDENAHSEH